MQTRNPPRTATLLNCNPLTRAFQKASISTPLTDGLCCRFIRGHLKPSILPRAYVRSSTYFTGKHKPSLSDNFLVILRVATAPLLYYLTVCRKLLSCSFWTK